jgi:hypothetical protein
MLLHDFGAFLVEKAPAAIGTEKLDFLMPELLPVTIKFALTMRARYPENFRHDSSWHQLLT